MISTHANDDVCVQSVREKAALIQISEKVNKQ